MLVKICVSIVLFWGSKTKYFFYHRNDKFILKKYSHFFIKTSCSQNRKTRKKSCIYIKLLYYQNWGTSKESKNQRNINFETDFIKFYNGLRNYESFQNICYVNNRL